MTIEKGVAIGFWCIVLMFIWYIIGTVNEQKRLDNIIVGRCVSQNLTLSYQNGLICK